MNSEREQSDEPAAAVYAAMLALWDKEADRYWTRNNILLALNAGMLGLVATGQASQIIRGAACLLGAFLAGTWIFLNRQGRYYTYRWRPVLEQYERELQARKAFANLPFLFTGTPGRPDSAIRLAALPSFGTCFEGAACLIAMLRD